MLLGVLRAGGGAAVRRCAHATAAAMGPPHHPPPHHLARGPCAPARTQRRAHGSVPDDEGIAKIRVVYITKEGERHEVRAPVGSDLMRVAHRHGIEMEGACEGSVACSTCHVIVDDDRFDLIPGASLVP